LLLPGCLGRLRSPLAFGTRLARFCVSLRERSLPLTRLSAGILLLPIQSSISLACGLIPTGWLPLTIPRLARFLPGSLLPLLPLAILWTCCATGILHAGFCGGVLPWLLPVWGWPVCWRLILCCLLWLPFISWLRPGLAVSTVLPWGFALTRNRCVRLRLTTLWPGLVRVGLG
jgi:hypothetical protein